MNTMDAHPLRGWRLQNFKAVEDASVRLAPLTVLVGANSAGKSSLIQSMLMVSQSAAVAPPDPDLALNGPAVELGEFNDLKRIGAAPRARVVVGCELEVTDRLGYVGGGPPSGVVRWQVELIGGGRAGDPGRALIHRVRLEVPGPGESTVVFEARRRRGVVPATQTTGLPFDERSLVAIPGKISTTRRNRGRSGVATAELVHRGGVPVSIVETPDDPDGPTEGRAPSALLLRLEAGGRALADLLAAGLVHLGPLRQDPQLLYLNTPFAASGDVGPKGERAFAVLHRYGHRPVRCPMPQGGARELALEKAVDLWMSELGVGSSVATVDRPRLGLEPRVRMEGIERPLSISAVGVGVSQVLPVVVMGLASPPGTVLLLEQPELHLHPAVQQRLGDFLLACADSGRQVVVETHSDHLLTRVRRRIAEDSDDRLAAAVAIVFAERGDGAARLRNLTANRYGGLDQWPEGFFDDAARDSRRLLEAGMRKKGQ